MPFTPDSDDLRVYLAQQARRTLGRARSFLRRPIVIFPRNDNFANRVTLSPVEGGWASFNNTGYTLEGGEQVNQITRTGWYKITPTERRIFRFRMTAIPTGSLVRMEYYKGSTLSNLQRFLTTWATSGGGDSSNKSAASGNLGWNASRLNQWQEVQLTAEEIQIQVGTENVVHEGTITFEWEVQEPPANDDWADSIELVGDSGTESGTTVGATWDTALATANAWPNYIEPADFQPWMELMRGVVWYHFTSLTEDVYRFTLEPTGTGEDMRLIVMQGDTYPTQLRAGWGLPDETVDVSVLGTCWIGVVAVNLGALQTSDHSRWRDTFDLHWERLSHPANDDFIDAEVISGNTGTSTNTDIEGAVTEDDEPELLASSAEDDQGSVWWQFSPSNSGRYTIATTTGMDVTRLHTLQVYTGEDLASLTNIAFYFQSLSSSAPSLQVGLRAGTNYYIRLGLISVYNSYANIDDTDYGGLTWNLDVAAPSNDDWENAEVISGSSGSTSGDNSGATFQEGEFGTSYDLLTPYFPTVWYAWEAPSSGYFRFQTVITAGTPDHDLMVFTGASVDALTPIVENWDGKYPYTDGEALLEFEAVAGTTYYIRVNSFDSTGAGAFDLEWQSATPPANDLFANATALASTESGGPTLYDTLGADIELEVGEPTLEVPDITDLELLGRSVWFSFSPPTSGTYEFTVDNEGFQAYFLLYELDGTASFENLTRLDFVDATYSIESLTAEMLPSKTYYIQILGYAFMDFETEVADPDDTWAIQQGQFQLSWLRVPVPPENDDLSVALDDPDAVGNIHLYDDRFRPSGGCYDATSRDATTQVGELSVAGFGPERTVWFYWQSSYTGTARFWTTSGSVTDQVMAVYDYNNLANPANPGTLLDSDDDSGPGLMPQCEFAVVAFNDYVIQVDTKDNPGGDFTLNWIRVTASPPINDNFADAVELSLDEGPTTLSGTTVDATVECDEPPQDFIGPHGSVWYHINSPVDRDILLTLKATSDANNFGIAAIIYSGSTLAELVDETDGFYPHVFDLNEEGSATYQLSADVDYYISVFTVSENGTSATGASFDITHELSSTTPPDGDPFEDPIDSSPSAPGGPIYTGTTEGSTVQDGEPEGAGGTLVGTVWHKFVPDYDGIYIFRVDADDPDVGTDGQIFFSVWEGPSLATAKPIPGWRIVTQSVSAYLTANPRVLRAGSSYYVRVERYQGDNWGTYTLNITSYPEYDDWTSADDGYDSVLGSGGYDSLNDQLTYTGEGGALVDPWRDLDDNPQNAGLRWIQMRFKMRVTSGETMFREGHFNALGVVRALDPDGDPVWELILYGNEDGTNSLAVRDPDDGDIRTMFAHFGTRGRDFNEWVDVEVVLRADAGKETVPVTYSSGVAINGVKKRSLVNTDEDGVPVTAPIRSLEFGAFHYPENYTTTLSSVGAPYQDPHDDWEIQIKDVVVRNRPTLGMISPTDTGDLGVTQFDGWEHEDPLDNIDPPTGIFGVLGATIVDAPGTPPGNADWWKSVRFENSSPTAIPGGGIYNFWLHNPKPWMGFWVYFEQFPETDTDEYQLISYMPHRYNNFNIGWAALMINSNGELRIAPQITERVWKSYCVASLQEQTWYWIEMELDASIVHEATVSVSINGNAMGDFEFANSYSDLTSLGGGFTINGYTRFNTSCFPVIWMLGPLGIAFKQTAGGGGILDRTYQYGMNCEMYISHVCMGRAVTFPLNPMQTKLFGGIDEDGTHNFPELPVEHEHLHTDARPYIWTFYDYTDETDTPNPGVGLAPAEFSYGTPGGGTIDVIADGTGNALIAAFNAIRWQPRPTIPDSPFGTRHFPRHGFTPYEVYEADEGGTSTDMFATTAWAKGVGTLSFADQSSGNAPVYSHITRVLDGDYEQVWGIAVNAWHPSVTSVAARVQGEWSGMTAGDFMYWKRVRMLLNPKVYPRFATSADNGATWTFLDDPTISTTNSFIGSDVTTSSGSAVWMNNTSAFTRMFELRHGINFPSFDGYPLHSVGYEMTDWYLEYTSVPSVSIPEAEEFGGTRGYNLHLRHAGYNYTPSTDRAAGDLYVTLWNGTHRAPMHVVTATTSDISRVRYPTDATGGHWTTSEFEDTLLRFGFYRSFTSGAVPGGGVNPNPASWSATQTRGAILEAVQWEVLSEAAPGPSARRCRRLQQIYRRAFG